jgi:hypothetical protein
MATLAITQIGDKKDRTYRIKLEFTNSQLKFFTVKGVNNNFMLFANDQHLQNFKTLTKCCDYIKTTIIA